MSQNSRYFIERSFRPAGSESVSAEPESRSLVADRLLVVIIIIGLIIGLVLLGSG
jgi:hypothetical protein